jgi:hypothetical protein
MNRGTDMIGFQTRMEGRVRGPVQLIKKIPERHMHVKIINECDRL